MLWTALLGCDSEDDATAFARGSLGESCTRRADCADDLLCIAQVCTTMVDAGPVQAAEGGACQARSDCRDGLVCNVGRCAQAMVGMNPDNRYGARGESCRAKNDCAPDLACVSSVCREVTLALAHTDKDCYRVECSEPADCCADFVPNANCDTYRDNCETDPIFCNTYRSLCECSRECVDEVCTAAAPGCMVDEECTSAQTPYCMGGRCRQCNVDASCPGAGTKCVQGACMAACAIDENCPLLHECQEGICVDVGCKTDRECVFERGDTRAACTDGRCNVPCAVDADCARDGQERFMVCEASRCVFVGCDNDAECRALLNLQSSAGATYAVCR